MKKSLTQGNCHFLHERGSVANALIVSIIQVLLLVKNANILVQMADGSFLVCRFKNVVKEFYSIIYIIYNIYYI